MRLSQDGYLFDLDGTIYLGNRLIDGADRVVRRLRDSGARVGFLTNNSNMTRVLHAEKLQSLGVPAEPDDVITASYAMTRWFESNAPGAKLWVVGETTFADKLSRAGMHVVSTPEDAEFVVSSFDRTFDYAKLCGALTAVNAGARLVATNPDRACPVEGTYLPDCASITAAIEAAANCTAELVIGKPSPVIGKIACEALGLRPDQCMMVGDSLVTDIGVGMASGMSTTLVLTGYSKREDIGKGGLVPDAVIEGIWEL